MRAERERQRQLLLDCCWAGIASQKKNSSSSLRVLRAVDDSAHRGAHMCDTLHRLTRYRALKAAVSPRTPRGGAHALAHSRAARRAKRARTAAPRRAAKPRATATTMARRRQSPPQRRRPQLAALLTALFACLCVGGASAQPAAAGAAAQPVTAGAAAPPPAAAAGATAAADNLKASLSLTTARSRAHYAWSIIAAPPQPVSLAVPAGGDGVVQYNVTFDRRDEGIVLQVRFFLRARGAPDSGKRGGGVKIWCSCAADCRAAAPAGCGPFATRGGGLRVCSGRPSAGPILSAPPSRPSNRLSSPLAAASRSSRASRRSTTAAPPTRS